MNNTIGIILVLFLLLVIACLLLYIEKIKGKRLSFMSEDQINKHLEEVRNALHNNPDHVANVHDAIKRGEEIINSRRKSD